MDGDDEQVASASEAPPAMASFGESQWPLAAGASLSVGRYSGNDLRVGSADCPGPEDLGVSRRAATLSYARGRIWIRNDSASQPLYVRPPVGPELVVEAGGMIVSLPDARFEIVLKGRVLIYRIRIEQRDCAERVGARPATGLTTVTELPLSKRERRFLAAVCEPILCGGGRPATWGDAATRLNRNASYVRRTLEAVRQRLADDGVPGMVDERDATDQLAWYAVRTGSITSVDIADIDSQGGSCDGQH